MLMLAWLPGLALAGCHYHRDTNAPGISDVHQPPRDIASERLQYPGDPGERMVSLSTGVLGGVGARSRRPHAVGDFAVEATLNWGHSERSHNDNASRLFIPRGLIWPNRATGVTLGWSAVTVAGRPDDSGTEVATGPIYVEVQRLRFPYGIGAGWAVNPADGDHGPQVNAMIALLFTRARYLVSGGFEFHIGYQLKIPTTWVWSR